MSYLHRSPLSAATPLQKTGLHYTTNGCPTECRRFEDSNQQCRLYNGCAPVLQPLCYVVHAEIDHKSCRGLNAGARTGQLTEYCDEVILSLPTQSTTPTEAGCPESKSGPQLSLLYRSTKVLEEKLQHSLLSQARYPCL